MKCPSCGEEKLPLAQFAAFASGLVITYAVEFTQFLMQEEEKDKAQAYIQANLHESERWGDFIVWLIGRNHLSLEDLEGIMELVRQRVGVVMSMNPSRFENH